MTVDRSITGVIPAALTPFDEQGRIHADDLRRHLEYLAGTPGVTGITVNGHAGEVASLSVAEQGQVLSAAREALPEGKWLVAGIYAHSTAEARELTAQAADAGADAVLVFPPEVWEFGVRDDPRQAYRYYEAVSGACELPLIAFVYPTFSPLHLSTDTVLTLCSEVPRIAAVKEWSNDVTVYEATLRGLRARHPQVSLLSSYSRSLLASLAVGADGILSGHGSLIPELQVALFAAIAEQDLGQAREAADALYELTQVFYAPPIADGFTRMKLAATRLGRMSTPLVREPLLGLDQHEIQRVEAVLPLLMRYARDASESVALR
jgi:4-hydroxy-tetrahydrodipicolinate synthase